MPLTGAGFRRTVIVDGGGGAGDRRRADLLYGIPPIDPATFGITALVLILVGGCANLVPARRASGVDPTIGLHFER